MMKPILYITLFLLAATVFSVLFRLYIYDNVWITGMITGGFSTYGLMLYNKRFGKKATKD